MAQKKISDLQLRSDFDDTCNFPVDDALQTWRVTGAQIRSSILGSSTVTRSMLAAGAIAKSAIATKTSAYTLVSSTDDIVNCDATSAGFSITLPAASSNAGKVFRIKKVDSSANVVTIARAGSDTIDGATSFTLISQYESATVISDGTNWYLY